MQKIIEHEEPQENHRNKENQEMMKTIENEEHQENHKK